jgi:hypothetical protein
MLATGTYAWINFGQQAKNEFQGKGSNPGGRLHDDFDGERNKDVYVENFGKQPLFVRIRLDEYMEIAGKSLNNASDKGDVTTWLSHKPDATVGVCDQAFHDYWTWVMGGADGERYYLPTGNKDRDSVDADISANFYSGADAATNPNLKPIPASNVILMQDWTAGPRIGPYWVYDTDGWAYWAMPLAAESATGLLVDAVNLTAEPEEEYYYGINVVLQMATRDDIALIGNDGGITPNGGNLLDIICGDGPTPILPPPPTKQPTPTPPLTTKPTPTPTPPLTKQPTPTPPLTTKPTLVPTISLPTPDPTAAPTITPTAAPIPADVTIKCDDDIISKAMIHPEPDKEYFLDREYILYTESPAIWTYPLGADPNDIVFEPIDDMHLKIIVPPQASEDSPPYKVSTESKSDSSQKDSKTIMITITSE